jgi:glucose/arabinose dehydrogenase
MLSHWLRYVAPIVVAALASSCAATLEAPVVNARYAPHQSERATNSRALRHPFGAQQFEGHRLAERKTPTAAPGFEVSLFAENLTNPWQAYVLPNGDILVVESIREWIGRPDRPEKSANRITLFRDTHKNGKFDLRETFLTGLNMPDGMALVGNWFYVGNTDGVVRYPYRTGQTKINGKGEKILDLPAGGHTRNLLADPAGKKIYVAVGSASNVDEENGWEKDQRAEDIEMNPTAAACGFSPTGCAIPSAWTGNRGRKCYGRSSTSATCSATISCPII